MYNIVFLPLEHCARSVNAVPGFMGPPPQQGGVQTIKKVREGRGVLELGNITQVLHRDYLRWLPLGNYFF